MALGVTLVKLGLVLVHNAVLNGFIVEEGLLHLVLQLVTLEVVACRRGRNIEAGSRICWVVFALLDHGLGVEVFLPLVRFVFQHH